MSPARRRWSLIGALVVAGSALGVIAFGNIGENLVYYWSPAELLAAGEAGVGPTVRLGGLVAPGTLEWDTDASELKFVVQDGDHQVAVHATGAPPQMFREGIGVVVEGTMSKSGVFESDRLMVKHSNEYRAPKEGVPTADLYKTVEGL